MNIFFDLDGTIINSQHRLFNLFCELCPQNKLSYEEYWDIKRKHITQKDFLQQYFSYTDDQIQSFRLQWFSKVEEENRLSQDFLVNGIVDVLAELSKNHHLYIVTNRQDENLTRKELKILGIDTYFKSILVTQQKISKPDLIRQTVQCSTADILIGDTGEDIKTAQALGCKAIAVSWGVLNKDILHGYRPDIVINEVKELLSVCIKNRTDMI